MCVSPGKTWYLPHHNVVNVNKPAKTRTVFDCAAEFAGTSLNKEVLQEPDFMKKLIGVLLRFREDTITAMADIKGMFYQVNVSPKDRNVLRFLWWSKGEFSKNVEVYRMTVYLFGRVWSPSCANFALSLVALDHMEDIAVQTTGTLYADDCLKSAATVPKAIDIVRELYQLLALRGFRLTKWTSNSRKVLEAIPAAERAANVKNRELIIIIIIIHFI